MYALPYISGAGNLGGETIETTWSELNKLAFLREGGPGMRKDGANEQCGDMNWRIVARSCTSNLLMFYGGCAHLACSLDPFPAAEACYGASKGETGVLCWMFECSSAICC